MVSSLSSASSKNESDHPTSTELQDGSLETAPGTATSVRVLSDDEAPAASELWGIGTKKFDSKRHKAETRKMLALAALGVLTVFHAAPLTLLAFNVITLSELTGIIAAFSGVQTLAAVAFAFYFAKS